MDDCVDESESLVSLSNLKTEEQVGGEQGEDDGEDKERRSGSGSDDKGAVEVDRGEEEEGVGEEYKKENADSSGGGLINQLISHLPVFGNSHEEDDDEEKERIEGDSDGKREEEVDGGGGEEEVGGGLIDQLISRLPVFGDSCEEERCSQEAKEEDHEEKKAAEDHEEKDADAIGGGFMKQLITNLPVSIPDNPSPEADEASLLIHIIQD